jgi:hypothetical protein
MAWEERGIDISLPADEDLSNDQYRIMVLDATSGKVRRPNAATDIPLGVLQNAPAAADLAAVVRLIGCGGVSKVQVGVGAQAIGVIVGMEYVSATDAGKAIAAATTMYPVGIVVGAAAAEDDLASVLLTPLTVKV